MISQKRTQERFNKCMEFGIEILSWDEQTIKQLPGVAETLYTKRHNGQMEIEFIYLTNMCAEPFGIKF